MTEQFADLTIDALKELSRAIVLLTDRVRMLYGHQGEVAAELREHIAALYALHCDEMEQVKLKLTNLESRILYLEGVRNHE